MGFWSDLVQGIKKILRAFRTAKAGPTAPPMPDEASLLDPWACRSVRACNAAYAVLQSGPLPAEVSAWLGQRGPR